MALIARKRRIDSGIDLTPLIDVVFQLLVFLMVSSQFTRPEAVVDLPTAPGAAPAVDPKVDKISLVIQADGEVTIDGETVAAGRWGEVIAAKVGEGVVRAEIRGDDLADYGVFVDLMEVARERGVESLGIVKKPEEPAP